MFRWFPSNSTRRTNRTPRARFGLTSLESRLAPAVFTVMNTNDSGAGSLRQAILDAAMPDRPGMDEITFDPSVTGMITLTSPLVINSELLITGPGANTLSVSGNKAVRVFEVNDSASSTIRATIRNLTIRDGAATQGSGFLVGQNDELVLTGCHVTGNTSSGIGGGVLVAAGGDLMVTGSTFSLNQASIGGAVYFTGTPAGGSIDFANTTISGNSAGVGGGVAVAGFPGDVLLRNSTILQNKATTGQGGGVVRLSGAGSISLVSSIVQGNTTVAGSGPDIATSGVVNYRNSLLGNSSGISSLVDQGGNLAFGTNPFVGSLALNGGRVPSHAVLAGSPVIDKGLNPATALETDIRGVTRSFGKTDIGAFELATAGIPTVQGTFMDVTSTGGSSYTFQLTYRDDTWINVANLSTGQDVSVSGPNGFLAFATFVSVDQPTNGSPRVATYSLTPPGGAWDGLDNGTYTVTMAAKAVYDNAANPVPGGDIGQFRVAADANSFLVTTTADSGPGSLRSAIGLANASAGTTDTITFDPMVFTGSKTIVLTTGSIAITDSVMIQGLGASVIAVSGNSADRIFTLDDGKAGAIQVTITDLTFTGGIATGPGGAISMVDETLELNGVVFSNNRTTGTGLGAGGGAIAITGPGTLIATNTTFTGNKATGVGGDGGAIRAADGSTVNLFGSTLSGNTANGDGGGLYQSAVSLPSSFAIISSAIVNNAATDLVGDGGGVFFLGTPSAAGATVRNSTISGNVAVAMGGGIAVNSLGADLRIQNSTITENSAGGTSKGGGVAQIGGPGKLVFESTIVSGNYNTLAPDVSTTGIATFTTSALGSMVGIATYQDLGNNLPVGVALGLGALANNGGTTMTHLPNAGSLVIDRGSNPAGLFTDQRGMNRVDGVAADIGAVEVSSAGAPVASAGPFANVIAVGGTIYDILVTYKDDVAVDSTTFGNNDIRVTGPNGFSAFAKFVSADAPGNGTPRVVTYRLDAPGGMWDGADAGLYTVSLEPSQVTDTSGNAAAAVTFGTFIVNLSTTYVVTNNNDAGAGSLRDALSRSNLTSAPDTITFDPTFFGVNRTIALTTGQLTIANPVVVQGTGASMLTVSGSNASRVFEVNDGSALTSAAVSINGMTITGGKASTEGGGLYLFDEMLSLTNVVVANNRSTTGSGGGIFVASKRATLTLTDSVVSGNTAGMSMSGGGIRVDSAATLTLIRSTVTGNVAQLRGGGIYFNNGGSLTVDSSAITGNVAQSKDGGGIYFFGIIAPPGLSIRNSTISGNSANTQGGGIALVSVTGVPVIQNSTITNNFAGSGLGGGISRMFGVDGVTLSSTIVAGNISANVPDMYFDTVTDVTTMKSLIGVSDVGNANFIGTNNLMGTLGAPLDPMLMPLASNFGKTPTHALMAGSPAINTGSNPSGAMFDQRGPGFVRVAGGAADMGAFEVQAAPTVGDLIINDGSVQRSRVISITVPFSNLVNFTGAPETAFKLEKIVGGVPVGTVVLNVDLSGSTPGQTMAKLTFAGPLTEYSSLADGNYRLTIMAGLVNDYSLNALDGNADETGGDNYVSAAGAIYRLYGDVDGDRTVSTSDFLAFRLGYLGSSIALDFEGDGIVNGSDFLQFRIRFLSSI